MLAREGISGVRTITPPRIEDARGYFSEIWSTAAAARENLPTFVQDNESASRRAGTIRGLHFQAPPHAQAKLVRCVRGAILDIAVDIRRGSPTFGQHVSRVLSAENGVQMFVPEGFAHGFATLEPETVVQYRVTSLYARTHDFGLAWDDPALAIDWRVRADEALLSDRDRTHPRLADLPPYFAL